MAGRRLPPHRQPGRADRRPRDLQRHQHRRAAAVRVGVRVASPASRTSGIPIGFALWHDGARDGYDRCAIVPTVGGAVLSGTATLPHHGAGASARYRLRTDDRWRLREVDVRLSRPGSDVELRLRGDGTGRWSGDGRWLPELEGCLDVDLDFTPAALTPAIRRLALPRGARVDVDVVRVTLPGLVPQRGRSGLEHDDRDRWVHHRADGSWALHVGPQGLVTEYQDRWTAVALG